MFAKTTALSIKKPLLFLCFFCVFSVQAEGIYKTVDKDGNVIFSDTPSPGAKEVELPELQTIKALEKQYESFSLPDSDRTEKSHKHYQSITIVDPADETALRSNNGNFTISVALEPALKAGHRLIIMMDGKEVSNGAATSVAIQNADRGTHELNARIVDTEGKTLIFASSSFSLLRVAQ